ncbi:phosphatase PAP2 family protein [Candidatus Dojkabacteria bacterium]|nr:phosphatase PAP2 family protein [Candidatus Dojkabacteria bacterium]
MQTKKDRSQDKVFLINILKILACLIISIGSLIIFLKIAESITENETLVRIDKFLSEIVYSSRTPWLDKVMLIVTSLGSAIVLIPIIIITIAFLIKYRKFRETVVFVFTSGTTVILNVVLKYLFQRPRPQLSPIVSEHFYSFPSGHAMNSFVFYAVITFLVFSFCKKKVNKFFFFLLSLIIVLLIGFSRVYLGVHYPSDIIGGYLGGLWVFITVLLVDRILDFSGLFKKRFHTKV